MSWTKKWPLLAAALIAAGTAFAAEPQVAATDTAAAPDAQAALEQVQAQKATAYRDVLSNYDRAIAAAPADVDLAVDRCRFINHFTDEEYGEWVESAPQDFEACSKSLATRWPDAPAAQLFALDQLWGGDAVERGEQLLKSADTWPMPLRRRLLAKVSQVQEGEDNTERAAELALQAARLGESGRVPLAVQHLAGQREYAEAARLLADTPPATESWAANRRIESAFDLPDAKVALNELRRYAKADFRIAADTAARAHLRAGDFATARRVLKDASAKSSTLQQVRFDVALAADDMAGAAAVVDLTDTDDFAANLERFLVLAHRAPTLLWSGPLLSSTLMLVLLASAIMLSPALLLVPAHYRGLIRQARQRPAVPLFEPIGLRRAWAGLALSMCAPVVAGAIVEPAALSMLIGGDQVPDPLPMARVMLWGTVLGLLCVLPLLRGLGWRDVIGNRTVLRESWTVPLSWAALISFAMLLAVVNSNIGSSGGDTPHTQAMEALADGGKQTYGAIGTLLLVAVLVPIFEEISYRGLLLGGLTRHISFGWANTVQAAVFAFSHDDLPRLPFYFVLGLLCGWLVKRHRALGPAIALHGLNNGLVFVVQLW